MTLSIAAEPSVHLAVLLGGYKIEGSTEGADPNYEISFENKGTYTVSQRAITIAFDDKTGIYGNALSALTWSITEGELAYGEQLYLDAFVEGVSGGLLPVGSHRISQNGMRLTTIYEDHMPKIENYAVTVEDGEYSVEARAVNVIIYEQTVQYGDDTFYSDEGRGYTVAGAVAGDDLGITIVRTDGSQLVSVFGVGRYPIQGSFYNSNYEVTFSAADYVVVRRSIEVTIDSVSSIYGEEDAALTFTVSPGALIGRDTAEDLKISLTREAGKDAGTYAITGVSSSEKYEVRFVDGVYTVEKREATVVIQDSSAAYGEEDPVFTFTVTSELAPGDTEETLGIVLSRTEGTDAGSYVIRGTASNENYSVTFTNGVHLISPAVNSWLRSYSIRGWMEGDPMGEVIMAQAKYGEVQVQYYTDSACTQEYEGDIAEAKAGIYYCRVWVEESKNYTGLTPIVYEFEVDAMPQVGPFLVLGIAELAAFAALIAVAVRFGGKKKH